MNKIVLIGTLSKRATMLAAMIMVAMGSIHAQCNFTLACNNLIQLSLGDDCTEEVTPDMILEGQEFPNSDYVVTLMLPNGTVLPDAMVDDTYIGIVLDVQVTLTYNDCNLSCWGNLFVEDKLAPEFDCPLDMTLTCGDNLDTSIIGGLELIDTYDCSGVDTLYFHDVNNVMPCGMPYSDILTRWWYVRDIYGNIGSCEQTIHLMAADVATVVMPADFIVQCEDLDVPISSLTPDVTGMPTLITCSNIQYYYNDLFFELCGSGFKIRREWHVIDWCTGGDAVGYQTIKVEDKDVPQVTNGIWYYEINSNNDACFATYNVPLPGEANIYSPTINFDCSKVNTTIEFAEVPDDIDCSAITELTLMSVSNLVFDYSTVNPNSDNDYIIDELPVGCNILKYTFTDECQHDTTVYKLIEVKDVAPPSAICEGYSVITIDHYGWGHINAESLDDHSWDSCDGPLEFTARRLSNECPDLPEANPDDLGFDEFIHFCCSDVGQYVIVELKVTDEAGNYNLCQASIYVDDKIAPLVSCPDDITIYCDDDYLNTDLTGMPEFDDNCGPSIHQDYELHLSDCGIGYVLVNHAIWDNAGNQVVCNQRIDIINETPLVDGDIDWPMDINTFVCGDVNLSPDGLNSKPVSNYDSDCGDIGMSYDDLKFYDVEGYCIKVVRTWTVVDWCADPLYYLTHVQKIHVTDNENPIFVCNDITVTANDDCNYTLDLNINVNDNCTAKSKLDISWTIELNSDDSDVINGTGISINRVLPAGIHNVNVTAVDDCGNMGHCSFKITITHDDKPTPVCQTEVIWVIDEDGLATVWAVDFDSKSYNGCQGENGLSFYFDENKTNTSLTFSCTDVPNGVEAHIPLQMYVFNDNGDYDFCSVTLILQDNSLDKCGPEMTPSIQGRVMNANFEGISDFEVELHNMSSETDEMSLTENGGTYLFDSLDMYNEYMVSPVRDIDYLEGVSTFDMILIQKHILGLEPLDSPYKMIAADVNNSESITGVDLIEMRKLILGVYESFPNQTSWDFVSTNYGMEDGHPWTYINQFDLNALDNDSLEVDFIAVKIGDVNQSAQSLSDTDEIELRSNDEVDLQMTLKETSNNQSIIAIKGNDDLYEGYQMAIDLPNGTVVATINSRSTGFGSHNWSISDNTLYVVWSDVLNKSLIELEIIIEGDMKNMKQSINLNQTFAAESYVDSKIFKLNLGSRNVNQKVSLGQNSPNPFNSVTTIKFNLPKGDNAEFVIQNVAGEVIYSQKDIIGSGIQELLINKEMFKGANGLFFYSLKTREQVFTKKLFIID